MRLLAARTLRRAGYRVIEAESPEDALAQGSRLDQMIDVLLTDVVMPGIGGKDLAVSLRAVRPDLPVAFMSGYTNGSLEERELLEQDATLIPKPFTSLELTRAVADLLRRREH